MTEEWMKSYPSVFVTRSYIGDRNYAELFHGEGNKLLYQLKNLMTFRNLGQLKMTRFFMDRTVITAKSIFGQDFINIDVSKSITLEMAAIAPSCTITLIDLPDIIQPMRLPGEIGDGEFENIDYIKTYYTYDISNCPNCNDISADFSFEFVSSGLPYSEGNINDHCVISEDGGCHGELIQKGEDEGGKYIIWKAYTESSEYNKSGLGYLLLTVNVLDINNTVICSTSQTIGVDCCVKDGLEEPVIYWASSGSVCLGDMSSCEAPSLMNVTQLFLYASPFGYFFALPQVGGCPIYEWSLTGEGSIDVVDSLGETAKYTSPQPYTGCDDITIKVKDRCGNEDEVVASCCQYASSPSIGYTTLQMSCGGSQELVAGGGCPPYGWNVSGGGSIEATGVSTANYYAPETNANCSNNPTITLTDCCKKSAELQLAVNCYTDPYNAVRYCHSTITSDCDCGSEQCCFSGTFDMDYIWCDGSFHSDLHAEGDYCCNLPDPCCEICKPSFAFGVCAGCGDTETDLRDETARSLGCCLLNPISGLPY